MKKNIAIILAVLFASAVSVAHSQNYVGGSFGLWGTFVDNKKGNEEKNILGCIVAPEFGFLIDDKMDFGFKLSLGFVDSNNEYGTDDLTYDISLAPFFRYSLFKHGKLNVLARTELYIGFGESTVDSTYEQISVKHRQVGWNLKPVLNYALSDRFALTADLNFLGFNLSRQRLGDNDYTNYGLMVNTDDLISIGGESVLTIGFVYLLK